MCYPINNVFVSSRFSLTALILKVKFHTQGENESVK